MYGLALTLSLVASLALWKWIDGSQALGWAVVYVAAGLAALYTLYYSALLLAAQAAVGSRTPHPRDKEPPQPERRRRRRKRRIRLHPRRLPHLPHQRHVPRSPSPP